MRYIMSFPILALVIGAYIVMGLSPQPDFINSYSTAYIQQLPSGAEFGLSVGDVFILAGLVALFLEMLKAARAGVNTILDHMLSMATFVAALVCFLLVEACGTSTFFLLMIMTLIDVVAGFSVSIFSTRRDFSVSRGDGGL